ncbi:MAG: GspE/PulE family protein [Patescibacteria group bacterium]
MAEPSTTRIPKRDLKGYQIPFEVLKLIPEESVVHYRFVPLGLKDGVLEVGIVDQDNIEGRDAVAFIASQIGLPYTFFLISEEDFTEVLKQFKGLSSQVGKALGQLGSAIGDLPNSTQGAAVPEAAGSTKQEAAASELEKEVGGAIKGGEKASITEEAPITKIVAVIIQHATEGNASDVHIEPIGERVRVRFRVDGVLYTSLSLPISVHEAVVARIKILTNMKLDEKRKPQDGRFSATIGGRRVDFRVSTLPTFFGEKVVIRILDQDKGVKKLDQIGLTAKNLKAIRDALAAPYGLILITGPTGSGKSTTLYSMLTELDREGENIVSLEDPVEYNIAGVNQSSVRPEIEYTFANGLRSILRQDPDVIMVGEIRDKETAQLAIQAALTGHLVFSTLHTNNAIGVIPRLIDMGVDPYLIAPTLILAIGQRLVRVLCEDSKSPLAVEGATKLILEKEFADLPLEFQKEIEYPKEVYRAIPSPTCSSGTKGRLAVFEMLPIDKDLQTVILKNPTEQEIYKTARAKGMLTMKEDAMLKAFKGIVPFEEVNRL